MSHDEARAILPIPTGTVLDHLNVAKSMCANARASDAIDAQVRDFLSEAMTHIELAYKAHDARVTELLEANNVQLERRRGQLEEVARIHDEWAEGCKRRGDEAWAIITDTSRPEAEGVVAKRAFEAECAERRHHQGAASHFRHMAKNL